MNRVGIIGAGQLGQMLGQAGQSLGLDFVFLDPADDPPAASVGPVLKFPFDSEDGLKRLADESDIITYEFENVPVTAVEFLRAHIAVHPGSDPLHYAQDRIREKSLLASLDIPVPAHAPVDSVSDLEAAAESIGLPIVLKTRRFGYDGKGQRIIRNHSDIAVAVNDLGTKALIAEQFVTFDRELSIIGTRSSTGEFVTWPLTENVHRQGILSSSCAPFLHAQLQETATGYLQRLMEKISYVGVLALELFQNGDVLMANEFAPRVHNSGHWTIEGAQTSQFENHLRAIVGMPLGDTAVRGHAAMANLIGEMPDSRANIESAGWHWHDYGKSARPGRKLGHVTTVTETAPIRDSRLENLAKYLNT